MDDIFDRSGFRLKSIIPNLFKVIVALTVLGAVVAFIAMVANEMNFLLALLIVAVSAAVELGGTYFFLLILYASAEQSENSFLILSRLGKNDPNTSGKDTWNKVRAAVEAEQPVRPVQQQVTRREACVTPVISEDGNAIRCPKCGTSQRSYRQNCYQCGWRFEKPSQEEAAKK